MFAKAVSRGPVGKLQKTLMVALALVVLLSSFPLGRAEAATGYFRVDVYCNQGFYNAAFSGQGAHNNHLVRFYLHEFRWNNSGTLYSYRKFGPYDLRMNTYLASGIANTGTIYAPSRDTVQVHVEAQWWDISTGRFHTSQWKTAEHHWLFLSDQTWNMCQVY